MEGGKGGAAERMTIYIHISENMLVHSVRLLGLLKQAAKILGCCVHFLLHQGWIWIPGPSPAQQWSGHQKEQRSAVASCCQMQHDYRRFEDIILSEYSNFLLLLKGTTFP